MLAVWISAWPKRHVTVRTQPFQWLGTEIWGPEFPIGHPSLLDERRISVIC